MKALNFFIIFHNKLFQENTSGFSPIELEVFKWVAVNEKIPKEIPEWVPKNSLLKEYEMKVHSPLYQMLNFYQNSVFFHLYWNKELIDSKYIGFGQYDMSFNADNFRKITELLKEDTADKIIPVFAYPFQALSITEGLTLWEEAFLKPYNSFYKLNHTFKSIQHIPLFLMHTFIMPTWFFLHIMPFVESILPNLLKLMDWNTRHLAGNLERVFALCISFGIIEGKFRQLVQLHGVEHVESQHSVDILRGIKEGCAK
jgi:hypothetical protein